MLNNIRKDHSFYWALVILAVIAFTGVTGCKSQKKIEAQKAAQERTDKIDQAKMDLINLINQQDNLTTAEMEDLVSEIRGMNLDDVELNALLEESENIIRAKREEQQRIEAEKRRQEEELQRFEENRFNKIEDYFEAIASSKSMEMANTRVNEALKFFASPQVPVLIITFMEGDFKDYDKPTTIRKYLEYLKDQGKNRNKIYNVQFDSHGKIIELELIKM
nr:hypothetical protein [Bacteroidota bacterium]